MASSATSRLSAILEYDDDDLPSEHQDGAEEYNYEVLPDSHHFRLLELLPGEGNSRLECQISIQTFDDEDLPKYRAVSYTWLESTYDNLVISGKRVTEFPGPRARYSIQHPIWCNDRRILISTNLRDALRRFRHPAHPLRFWIDAVCINQDDMEERANQVILMPKIYHSAVAVWFWLGESDEVSRMTLQWIEKLSEATKSHSPVDINLSIGRDECGALVSFLQRPVFQRIWIVQELVTARQVIAFCGDYSLPFIAVQHAINIFTRNSLDITLSKQFSAGHNYFHCINVIHRIKPEWYRDRRNVRQRLVLATRNFLATDPRDKIFALMGLFNDFAHRDSCHLGLCGASHRTATFEDAFKDGIEDGSMVVVRHRESEFGRGGMAITSALRELLAHHAKVQLMKQEQNDANVLSQSSNEKLKALHLHLTKYLRSTLTTLTRKIRDFGGEMGVGRSIHEDGQEANNINIGNEGNIQALVDFFNLELESSDLRAVQAFMIHVVKNVGDDCYQIQELGGHQDTEHLYARKLHLAESRIRYFLRLIEPETSHDGSPADGPQHCSNIAGEKSFCDFNFPHDSPFSYEPGEFCMVHLLGRYLVSCSSCDIQLFASALDALGRSETPPHQQCTLKEASWRLLKAVFGDMSGWVSGKPQVKIKIESDRDDQLTTGGANLEQLVETKWLTLPISWYLEEAAKKMNHEPERVTTEPLQHWSWSSSISRMPDYRMSVMEIYREFALRCLYDDPDLFILSAVEDRTVRRTNDIPSWVPDFSVPLSRSLLVFPDLGVMIPYTTSGESKPQVSWSTDNPDVVTIRGYIVDSVSRVIDAGTPASLHDIIQQSMALVQDLPSVYTTGEPKTDAIWRTLTANVAGSPAYEYPAPGYFSEFFAVNFGRVVSSGDLQSVDLRIRYPDDPEDDLCSHNSCDDRDVSRGDVLGDHHGEFSSGVCTPNSAQYGLANDDSFEADSETHDEDILSSRSGPDDLQNAADRAMRDRKFFVTKKGLFGIGPLSIKEGDLVCLFAGGRIPYIIRPCLTPMAGGFTFIGECYCHGLCEGQALTEPGFSWRDIQLM